MTDTFLLFPKNQAFIRGEKRAPVNDQGGVRGAIMLLVIIVFIGFSIALVYQALTIVYDNQLMAQNSAQIVGQVTNLYTVDNDGVTYYLAYQFTLPERVYEDDDIVTREIYLNTQIGQPINITYAVDDPIASRLTDVDNTSNNIGIVILTVGFIGMTGVAITSLILKAQRRSQLQRVGKIIQGELVSIAGESDEGDYKVDISVRFRSPKTLQWVSGKRTYSCNHLKKTQFPKTTLSPVSVAIHYADDTVWEVL